MRQVFIPKSCIDLDKKQAILVDQPFHHLIHVLRKGKGQSVQAFDGLGHVYTGRIAEILQDRAILELEHVQHISPGAKYALFLAMAVLKGKKMSWAIQKITELGVQNIVPLITRRTIVRPKDLGPEKLPKWEKIAIEASKQCGRAFVPNIHHPIKLQEFLAQTGDFDARLLAWEGQGRQGSSLRDWGRKALPALADLGRPASVLLLIGPEGGFDAQEIGLAQEQGCTLFGMGKNILRSETAALVASALVMHELEDLPGEQ